ncbi:putative membrane protein [Pelomonas saccharophila]|uniref:Membrane protein n=1 Tax=Roseateles saccharophilus TaxID=304 RepID=A0ABU1YHB2_ROSSA|nr:anthrone oxygenase family protein [Roseateles saccharophilus]MDR7268230.1 putative membrane protein [Roseateles saccharophilus]
MTTLLNLTTLLATLGSLLMAGVFFAFSTAVMPALAGAASGMQLMQTINEVILNRVFLGIFVVTALLACAAAALGWAQAPRGAAVLLTAGALAYVVGVFGVTAALNVPMNEALAKLGADSVTGQNYWQTYLRDWTFWNTVRTLAGLASGACLVTATMLAG